MILVDAFCSDAGFALRIIVKLVKLIKWIIPIILMLMITIDLAKAMMGNVDDKAKKDAMSKASKRVIYAVIVFLLPTILSIIFKQIEPITTDKDSGKTSTSWISCWNQYYNE